MAVDAKKADTHHDSSLPTSTIIAIVVAFVVGISSIVTASFCVIRSRRRRRRREEAARHVAAEAKKEYDEKLPRPGGATSRVDFGSGADFSASETMSPISPFDDEQRVRYDVPINVVDHSADAASINMENGRAMSMGTQRRNRSRHGGNSVPSRARTLDPRRRNDVPLVRELDSDRASARAQVIRTLPIREGDITPYTLPPMPESTMRSGPPVLNLTIPPDTYHPSRPVPSARNWRRPSDEATVDTLATDDYDVLAEDGSSLARTLTTESGESGTFPATHGMFRSQQGPEDTFRSESPVAWGPGPFGDEYQSSGPDRFGRMARETDFDDASTITEDDAVAPSVPMSVNNAIISGLAPTPTLSTAHASSSGSSNPLSATYDSSLNPFADPTSSSRFGRPRFSPAPQSDAGRSEISSGARTEASFRPGDDARSDVLNLGSRWRSGAQRPMTARNGIAVTYSEDLDAEDDQTTPSDTSRALAPPLPRRSTGDNMSATDEDDYIRTLEGALSGSRKRTEDGREVLQLPPSYDEVFGNM